MADFDVSLSLRGGRKRGTKPVKGRGKGKPAGGGVSLQLMDKSSAKRRYSKSAVALPKKQTGRREHTVGVLGSGRAGGNTRSVDYRPKGTSVKRPPPAKGVRRKAVSAGPVRVQEGVATGEKSARGMLGSQSGPHGKVRLGAARSGREQSSSLRVGTINQATAKGRIDHPSRKGSALQRQRGTPGASVGTVGQGMHTQKSHRVERAAGARRPGLTGRIKAALIGMLKRRPKKNHRVY